MFFSFSSKIGQLKYYI